MIDRTEARFALKPKRLAADTAYGTGKFLGWLVKEKRITPHIPVWEKGPRAIAMANMPMTPRRSPRIGRARTAAIRGANDIKKKISAVLPDCTARMKQT